MSQELLMECAYDWGKMLRIYRDRVQIHDTTYALSDLLSVQPTYHRFMGVSSARLVLKFTQQTVTLRGIAEVDAVRQAVVFLDACALHHDDAIEPITEYIPSLGEAQGQLVEQREDLAQMPTLPVATAALLQRRAMQKREIHTRRAQESHTRNLHEGRSQREHDADVQLLVQRLQEQPLPTAPVPLRLQRDEYALYSTPATMYQEVAKGGRLGVADPSDQGMLIFTNRRLIYMGRTNQCISNYAHLLHYSYQKEGITIHTEQWPQGNVFAVRRPLECSIYLEAIMQCFRTLWANSEDTYEAPKSAMIEHQHFTELYAHTDVTSVAAIAAMTTAPVALVPAAATDWKVAEEF